MFEKDPKEFKFWRTGESGLPEMTSPELDQVHMLVSSLRRAHDCADALSMNAYLHVSNSPYLSRWLYACAAVSAERLYFLEDLLEKEKGLRDLEKETNGPESVAPNGGDNA